MTANGHGNIRILLSQHGLGRIRRAVNALDGQAPSALTSVPTEATALRDALHQIRDALHAGAADKAMTLVDQLLAPAAAIDEAFDAMEQALREAREAVAAIDLPTTAQDIEGGPVLEQMNETLHLASGSLADVAARAAAYARLISEAQ